MANEDETAMKSLARVARVLVEKYADRAMDNIVARITPTQPCGSAIDPDAPTPDNLFLLPLGRR